MKKKTSIHTGLLQVPNGQFENIRTKEGFYLQNLIDTLSYLLGFAKSYRRHVIFCH